MLTDTSKDFIRYLLLYQDREGVYRIPKLEEGMLLVDSFSSGYIFDETELEFEVYKKEEVFYVNMFSNNTNSDIEKELKKLIQKQELPFGDGEIEVTTSDYFLNCRANCTFSWKLIYCKISVETIAQGIQEAWWEEIYFKDFGYVLLLKGIVDGHCTVLAGN